MKRCFIILLLCRIVSCYASEKFVNNGVMYQVNEDEKSVTVTYMRQTGWNWKSTNNYDAVALDIPEKVLYGDVVYTVTAIGMGAFSNSHNLKSITLPSTINRIDNYAFSCCEKLKELFLPNGLETINGWAFFNCSFDKLFVPSSLKIVEGAAFFSEISSGGALNVYISDLSAWMRVIFSSVDSNPTKLHLLLNDEPIEDLIIPDDIDVVNNYALMRVDCKTLTVPDNVTSIGSYAFYGCKAGIITIGDGVETIESWALSYCSYNTIELGSNVKTISGPNFNNIPNLSVVISHSPTPPTFAGSQFFTYFHGRDDDEDDYNLSNKILYVPAASVNAYKTAEQWSRFGQILPIDPLDVKEIKTGEVTVPDANAPIYDLMGRHLQRKPASGYYIQGGKKYFVK